ncbi:thiamine phosphate synthase [Candidatus Cryosericum odellii]|uniref:Thiamine-phosphate synthase n=1 Tax=Candidatus Cryosericum odellii TaxID=2290917 RepID=A0A398DCC4_9BACT|nr:thiamine phosphate synthase [Candidatus Cryosericum odellii]RIE07723.1 thiamine phosphate synthase [Candidatus Cryosericum odellii]RIE09938.1 thiamine phosphate synthase [Candidatus Cryosericum odellii]
MKPEIDYSLYLVTDRDLMSTPTLEQAVEQAIEGGSTLIQLREKTASSLEFYQMAVTIKRLTDSHHIPLIINDRVDIALAVDTAGVHIGQSDLPAGIVRQIIGKNKILGVSVSSVAEAVKAKKDGADYLGVGAMFATGTKTDADLVTMNELRDIRSAVSLPIVVIGGINLTTIPSFVNTGIDGIAVASALISAKDITEAAKQLRASFSLTKGEEDV